MRTFESRKTPNLSGVTAACAAALAVFALAACSYPSAPGAAQGVDPAAIFQDAAGLVRVSIPLPTGGGGGGGGAAPLKPVNP
ncbi:MAG: hypothetical protein LBU18_00935, partial [Treponema sp.]|nr:hypothetical protein [Treponema sp.]